MKKTENKMEMPEITLKLDSSPGHTPQKSMILKFFLVITEGECDDQVLQKVAHLKINK